MASDDARYRLVDGVRRVSIRNCDHVRCGRTRPPGGDVRVITARLLGCFAALLLAAALAAGPGAASSPAASQTGSAPLTVVQSMAKADGYWVAHGVSRTGATWKNST